MKTLSINLFAVVIIFVCGTLLLTSPPAHSLQAQEWEACCWSGESVCCGDRCEASGGACCANGQCDTPPWSDDNGPTME